VNADGHPLMARMHRPGDEKRMPVLLAPGDFEAWLHATDDQAHALLRRMPAVPLTGEPAPRPPPPRLVRRTAPRPAPDDTGSLF
jgi:putative SOS response-associated peptidase YedK